MSVYNFVNLKNVVFHKQKKKIPDLFFSILFLNQILKFKRT
jgi:hypothetical protein